MELDFKSRSKIQYLDKMQRKYKVIWRNQAFWKYKQIHRRRQNGNVDRDSGQVVMSIRLGGGSTIDRLAGPAINFQPEADHRSAGRISPPPPPVREHVISNRQGFLPKSRNSRIMQLRIVSYYWMRLAEVLLLMMDFP